MKVVIWGIGYVGAVTSACLAKSGHDIIAVDVDEDKVDCLNRGCSPIIEKELDFLIAQGIERKKIRATSVIEGILDDRDMSLICVGTPSDETGHIDYKYITDVCTQIGSLLKDLTSYHIVVVRSTILPGTMRDIVIPILERISGKIAGRDFGVGYNPEFLREGCAIEDYFAPTQIVAAALNDKDADAIMSLYEDIEAPRSIVTLDEAEAVKYVSNIWRANKISFANEMGNIFQSCGLDSHKVMDVFAKDTKINHGPAFLKPGFAFGGSCLPKDIRAMRARARDNNIITPLLDAALQANDVQINKAINIVLENNVRKILLLGLSFKPDTDDLRESPYVILARALGKNGVSVDIIEPNIYGSELDLRERKKNFYKDLMSQMVSADNIDWSKYDLAVLGHATTYFNLILEEAPASLKILALTKPKNNTFSYQGLCW